MALADFGVAFVIIAGLAVAVSLIVRDVRRRRHPALTTAEKTARLEEELGEINRKIEEIDQWDT